MTAGTRSTADTARSSGRSRCSGAEQMDLVAPEVAETYNTVRVDCPMKLTRIWSF